MIHLDKTDLFVFALYFLVFVTIAFYAGRKKRVLAADFFINQNRLPWYVIGFSMIASGISSEQFLGTVGFAYEHGLSVANWEWLNGPSILILVFLFIPFYLRKKVITMPHFLEHRFDGHTLAFEMHDGPRADALDEAHRHGDPLARPRQRHLLRPEAQEEPVERLARGSGQRS